MAELFGRVSPEKAGVSSRNVIKYIEHLKKRGVVFHSLMLLKGNDIFCEAYVKPFDRISGIECILRQRATSVLPLGF